MFRQFSSIFWHSSHRTATCSATQGHRPLAPVHQIQRKPQIFSSKVKISFRWLQTPLTGAIFFIAIILQYNYLFSSRGSVLAFGTQVSGFKSGRSRRIFQREKILSTPSFGREVKPFVLCHIFAACKRIRKCVRGSRSFRSKLPAISRPSSSFFHY